MANHFRFQKVVFYWLKPVPRPAVCFVEFLCLWQKGKKAQNWGFEITNVRYGHQAAFCSHFNDGSNSCFQTTNWIATLLHGNGHFGQHLCGLFLQLFSLIIIIADSCPAQRPSWSGTWRNFEVQILPKWLFTQLLSFQRSNIGKLKVVLKSKDSFIKSKKHNWIVWMFGGGDMLEVMHAWIRIMAYFENIWGKIVFSALTRKISIPTQQMLALLTEKMHLTGFRSLIQMISNTKWWT